MVLQLSLSPPLEKRMKVVITMCTLKEYSLVVLVVPVVLQLRVVDCIEERHAGDGKLEKGCNASTLGENVLVLPTPPGTANGTSNSIW